MTRIANEIGGTNVVTHHTSWSREYNSNINKQFSNPNGFNNCVGTARYSASVEDFETIGCFFKRQAITLGPKNTAQPVVDQQVSLHPAQSASEYATMRNRDVVD